MRRVLGTVMLVACGAVPSVPVRQAPTPITLGVSVGTAFADRPFDVVVTGAPAGARVGVVVGSRPGAGPCWPQLGGACLDLLRPAPLGIVRADATGTATMRIDVPFDAVAGTYGVQAGVLAPGAPGTSAVAVFDLVGVLDDTDGDGARDVIEVERGMDRFDPDTDGDGLGDGADPRPLDPGPFDTFVVHDVTVSDPAGSLPDPEVDNVGARITWQDLDGDAVWVADLDPATGAIVPPDGRGALVDTQVAPIRLGANGPEWVQTSTGAEVVYVGAGPGYPSVYRAAFDGVAWHGAELPGSTRVNLVLGSQDVGDPDPRLTLLVREAGVEHGGWRSVDDPSTETALPVLMVDQRWAIGERAIYGSAPDASGVRQVQRYDPATGDVTTLTTDAWSKQDVFAWAAPELGGEVVFFAGRGQRDGEPTEVALYRRAGGTYEAVQVVPTPAAFPYVVSPEVFVWAGHSYVSFVASDRPRHEDNGRAQVWIGALTPGSTLVRRVSDTTDLVRKDAETFVGGARPWVLYTILRDSGQRLIQRCELGL